MKEIRDENDTQNIKTLNKIKSLTKMIQIAL